MLKPDTDTPHYPKTYFNGRVLMSRNRLCGASNRIWDSFSAAYIGPNGYEVCRGEWVDTEEQAITELTRAMTTRLRLMQDFLDVLEGKTHNSENDE